jgi:hypothetical protein
MSEHNEQIALDPKYAVDVTSKEVVNQRTGHPIPVSEPRMLFRAKDACVVEMLERYWEACSTRGATKEHLQSIDDRIHEFRMWQRAHAGQVKIPD